jgi:multimeric flavodoxin WrbA
LTKIHEEDIIEYILLKRSIKMNKNIIILNGSPRPKGNTSALIRLFTQGAEESGNTVNTFFLDRMKINGCKGCYGGGKNPDSPCVQKDDMEKIYPVYKEADVIVLASPLYYFNLSGQLLNAFYRLFAVAEINPEFQNPKKECALLAAAEGHEFDELTHYYNGLVKHLGWKNLGMVLAGGVNNIGDIEGKPVLEEARKLGTIIK